MQISSLITYTCDPTINDIVLLLLAVQVNEIQKAPGTNLNVISRKLLSGSYDNTDCRIQNFENFFTSKRQNMRDLHALVHDHSKISNSS